MNPLHKVATLCPLGWDALVHSKLVCGNTSVNLHDASFPTNSRDFQYWGCRTTEQGGREEQVLPLTPVNMDLSCTEAGDSCRLGPSENDEGIDWIRL